LVLGRIFFGKWLNLARLISLVSAWAFHSLAAFWPYALCSVISIMSKYVLRVKGATFGIHPLRHLRPAVVGAGDGFQPEHTVGNYIAPMLVIWIWVRS